MTNLASYPGRLIVFEGMDGTGKSTQVRRLHRRLQERGKEVLLLREPGGTPLGEGIRDLLLQRAQTPMSERAELFLFLAARAQLCQDVIQPALEEGKYVLCDRFTDSTLAYQGYGRGLPLDELRQWNQRATGGLEADLTFIFDMPEASLNERLARRRKGKDRLEEESLAFHRRVRQGYRDLLREGGRRYLVYADRPIVSITKYIEKCLEKEALL